MKKIILENKKQETIALEDVRANDIILVKNKNGENIGVIKFGNGRWCNISCSGYTWADNLEDLINSYIDSCNFYVLD